MDKTLRWGILGTGPAARNFAAAVRRLKTAELYGVASREKDRAMAFAREFGAPLACAPIEQLLEERRVDIVYIATPNSMHRRHAIMALDAGKPVLCEKPFALDAVEAREIIATARRQHLFCMEAMWTRFLPAVRELRRLVDTRIAGEIRFVSASLGNAYEADSTRPLFRRDMGGGALLDLGVYAISFVSLVLGQPSSAVSSVQFGTTGVDEQVGAVLGFAGGAQATIVVSLRADLPSDAVIVGTEGRLLVHSPLYRPERITITKTSGPRPQAPESTGLLRGIKGNPVVRAAYHHASRLLAIAPHPGRGTSVWPVEGNGYGYQGREAMRCVLAGLIESPVMPLDETIAVMETVDAVRQAWGAHPVS